MTVGYGRCHPGGALLILQVVCSSRARPASPEALSSVDLAPGDLCRGRVTTAALSFIAGRSAGLRRSHGVPEVLSFIDRRAADPWPAVVTLASRERPGPLARAGQRPVVCPRGTRHGPSQGVRRLGRAAHHAERPVERRPELPGSRVTSTPPNRDPCPTQSVTQAAPWNVGTTAPALGRSGAEYWA
jgi:hypothetical protein